MKMVQAFVRPEKTTAILKKLASAGYHAATKMSVLGRGKQQGVTVGGVHYDEVLKECIMIVIQDEEKDEVIDLIANVARSGEDGNFGDGKIFILPVEKAYTISSGEEKL